MFSDEAVASAPRRNFGLCGESCSSAMFLHANYGAVAEYARWHAQPWTHPTRDGNVWWSNTRDPAQYLVTDPDDPFRSHPANPNAWVLGYLPLDAGDGLVLAPAWVCDELAVHFFPHMCRSCVAHPIREPPCIAEAEDEVAVEGADEGPDNDPFDVENEVWAQAAELHQMVPHEDFMAGVRAWMEAAEDLREQVAALQAEVAELRAEVQRHQRTIDVTDRSCDLAQQSVAARALTSGETVDTMYTHFCELLRILQGILRDESASLPDAEPLP